MFYTKEQIEEFNYNQCKAALRVITKMYNLDKPLHEHFKEVWPIMDDITNTILYLEDRIRQFEDPRISTMSTEETEIKPVPVVKVRTGRSACKYRINDKVYENIHDAAKQTGIKLQTLKTYVSRHPDRYGYID